MRSTSFDENKYDLNLISDLLRIRLTKPCSEFATNGCLLLNELTYSSTVISYVANKFPKLIQSSIFNGVLSSILRERLTYPSRNSILPVDVFLAKTSSLIKIPS
jgi:hypothetical protein